MLLRRIMAFIAGAVLIAFFLPAGAESAGGYDPAHPEYLEGSNLSCTSAILINADTGEVLFEKSPCRFIVFIRSHDQQRDPDTGFFFHFQKRFNQTLENIQFPGFSDIQRTFRTIKT